MKKLIIANWKGLPATREEAEEIVRTVEARMRELGDSAPELVICPPFEFIENVAKMLGQDVWLGAQDMAPQALGAGARYVIIGHSDRRWKLNESEETVNSKLKTALEYGIKPLVCLGERSREGAWRDELAAQTASTFRGMTPGQVSECLIAYEPVWAISTSPDAKPDTPASAVQAMGVIRDTLVDQFDVSHPTFLYGGSVTQANAADFLSRSEISGVLVGGASVRPAEFCRVLTIAAGIIG
jgi:triosephosphate isomerase